MNDAAVYLSNKSMSFLFGINTPNPAVQAAAAPVTSTLGAFMTVALILLTVLVFGLNSAATYILVRSHRYDRRQKTLQALLVWVVPVVGALLVWSLARDTKADRVTTDLTDNTGLDGYKIPDGVGEGIGRE